MSNLNGYELSRNFWNWAFENPEKISPNHSAIYFFAIEHCNRLGWREKFGFPTMMACDAIGIKKASTYIRYLNDLVDWGFIEMVQKSTNQYSSNIIRLNNALPKNGEALGKAIVKHRDKQSLSMGISKCPIDKPITIELLKPLTEKQKKIVYEVSEKFNINEMTPNFRLISEFVRNCKSLDEFVIQNKYYHLYKEQNNEIKHGIKSYLGDGEWKAYNWESKYNSIAKKESKNSHLFRA